MVGTSGTLLLLHGHVHGWTASSDEVEVRSKHQSIELITAGLMVEKNNDHSVGGAQYERSYSQLCLVIIEVIISM